MIIGLPSQDFRIEEASGLSTVPRGTLFLILGLDSPNNVAMNGIVTVIINLDGHGRNTVSLSP